MTIHYTMIVPPHVARDPDAIIPFVTRRLPTTVGPAAMTLNADLDIGLTIEFDLDYTNLAEAKTALQSFFAEFEKVPDPPAP